MSEEQTAEVPVSDFKDLKFEAENIEQLDLEIQKKVGISFQTMKESLQNSLSARAGELVSEFKTIAPNGDYSVVLEDEVEMLSYLRDEASKSNNWEFEYVQVCESNSSLLEFVFYNRAVNEGEELKGYVYVSKSGQIRHSFAQCE
jgi:hypothetical protein